MGADQSNNFEDVLKEHENIIYYLINRMGIRDPEGEFYQEGVIAMWKAFQQYDPERGKFSSYAYFIIEYTFKDIIRKRNREKQKEEAFQNHAATNPEQFIYTIEHSFEPHLFEQIRALLTENQMKWFELHRIKGYSLKEIAEMEKTTVDAVKNWGRLAKAKIMRLRENEEE